MDNIFSVFGASFQKKLAFLLLEDRVFADRMQEVLKVEYLERKHLQIFVDKIFEYKKKYKTHPSREIMETILRSDINEENEIVQKELRSYYAEMLANSSNLSQDADF